MIGIGCVFGDKGVCVHLCREKNSVCVCLGRDGGKEGEIGC